MIAAQLTLDANVLTEVYVAEVLDAEALQAKMYLCNQSAAHWVDVDVVLAHGATAIITLGAPVRGAISPRRYLYRGHSMRPSETKRINLELRHGDIVLVSPSTGNVSCTVLVEELVTPRALQSLENRLDTLVEDIINKQAIAEATTEDGAVARSNTRLVRYPLMLEKTINGTGTETSTYVSLEYAERVESLMLKASSVSGTADVKAEYASSWDTTEFENFDDTSDITSSTLLARTNSPEGWNIYSMSSPLNRYIRIRITGVAVNPTDTIVSAYLIVREGYA